MNSKEKRVLVISPALTMGGVQRAALEFACSAQVDGFQVSLGLLYKQKHFFEVPPTIELIEPSRFPQNFVKRFLMLFQTVNGAIKKVNPDYVVVYGKFNAACVAWLLKGKLLKFVISDRNSPHYYFTKSQKIFLKLAFWWRKPDIVLAQTEVSLALQKRQFGKKPKYVLFPNLLDDLKSHWNVGSDGKMLNREPFILAVGRLDDHLKGMDWLVEIFSRVRNTDWKLKIAGGALDQSESLKHLIESKGLINRIEFLGKVVDLDELYAKAGIFVITSRSEGFPNALAEAMVRGIPCVSYRFEGGAADLITNDKVGILVEYGNHDQFAASIDDLIGNESKRKELGLQGSVSVQRLLRSNRRGEIAGILN